MGRSPPTAPAARRNSGAILGVLEREFARSKAVLEIGSGTGEHAVIMAASLTHLSWQATDLGERLPGIRLQIEAAGSRDMPAPIVLDVTRRPEPGRYDGVFTANTLHIVDEAGVEGLVAHAAAALVPGGRFCCYGPFRRDGDFSTPSNARFDASLRAGGVGMGIRDLETVDALCDRAGLGHLRTYAMPANNLLVVWEKMNAG